MAYNEDVNRTDADSLIPTEYASEIVKNLPQQSAALSLFKHAPMSRKQERIPVMDVLPMAYFVNGDTGLKQTTKAAWRGVFLIAEPIACIIPVPDDVVADAEFDMWGELMPSATEAIGMALDGAVFFGSNKPASWPTDIVSAATANPPNNTITRGTAAQGAGGVAKDLSDLYAKLEAEGYNVNAHVADITIKGALRASRDTTGQKLLDVTTSEVEGSPIQYPMAGLWPTGAGSAELIAGDFSQGVLGVRSDIAFKVLTESVITDSDGNIIYNLPQQDMSAVRLVARFAFAVPNPVSRRQSDATKRYPFGVLKRP